MPRGEITLSYLAPASSILFHPRAQTVTVENSQTKTVTFDGAAVKEKWLTGSSDAVVNRKGD